MFKFNKIYLSIFFIVSSFYFGNQLVAQSDVSQNILSEKDLEETLSILNNSDFSDIENSEFLDFFRNPAMMAEKLPQSLREEVITAWEVSGNIAGKIMNPAFSQDPMLPVLELCNSLKTKIKQKELIDVVLNINILLGSQKFIAAIRYNLFDEDIKKELAEKLSELENILSNIKDSLDSDIYDNLLILKDIILSLKTDNFDLFFESINKYSSKSRIQGVLLFNGVLQKLDEFLKTEQDNERREAALFFKEEIFDGLKPLMNAIDEHGNIDQLALSLIPFGPAGEYLLKTLKVADKTSKISPAMLFSYGFYQKFLSYYLMDNDYSFKLLLGDSAISLLVLPIYILKKISDINKMRGNASQDEISFFAGNALSEIAEFYSDPNFLVKKSKWPMRSFYRISSALAYYNFWHRSHSSDVDNLANTSNENNNKYYRYWPKEFKHFKNSIWFSLKDGYLSLGNALERGIYSRVDNNFLDKIENNSLGLIKPELISFALNTAMPLLTYKYFPKNIANIDKEAVFAAEKPLFLNQQGKFYKYFIRPVGFGFGHINSSDSINYVGNRNYDKISDGQYIEGRILGYLSVSLGTYFGKKASLKFKKQFSYLLGKFVIKSCDKLGIFNFEEQIKNLEDNGFDFSDLSQDKKKLFILNEMLKENLPLIFSDQFGPHVSKIRGVFLSILLESKTFTQLELAHFEKEMMEGTISSEKIDEFSQKILDALVGGVAQKVGGFVGGFSSWLVTDMLVKKYTTQSPIYKQVLNRFNS